MNPSGSIGSAAHAEPTRESGAMSGVAARPVDVRHELVVPEAQASAELAADAEARSAPTLVTTGFVRLPPGRRYVWVPTADRDAALAGLSLYAPSRRRALLAHRMLWAAVRALGPVVLPGRRHEWHPPMDVATWSGLLLAWRDQLGEFDAFAVYERPQASRNGIALLLLRGGRRIAFVKVRSAPDSLVKERLILDALAERPHTTFRAARVVAAGAVDKWHWLAMTPLEPAALRAGVSVPCAAINREVAELLGDRLPKPAGTPDHWQPAHGDLVPWNVRLNADGIWLLDWEDAGWAPPGADEAYYDAVRNVVYGSRLGSVSSETAAFWSERIAQRSPTDYDHWFNQQLAALFASLAGRNDVRENT